MNLAHENSTHLVYSVCFACCVYATTIYQNAMNFLSECDRFLVRADGVVSPSISLASKPCPLNGFSDSWMQDLTRVAKRWVAGDSLAYAVDPLRSEGPSLCKGATAWMRMSFGITSNSSNLSVWAQLLALWQFFTLYSFFVESFVEPV